MGNQSKKLKISACSKGDSSVGMPSYCEDIEVEIYSNKVKVNPIKKDSFDSFEESLSKNLLESSDHEIEKTLLPIFNEMDFDDIATENTLKERNKMEDERMEEGFMMFLDEMSSEKRTAYLQKEYKGNPLYREKVKKDYQIYKNRFHKK